MDRPATAGSTEPHLFILWAHARPQQERILADIAQLFRIRAVWDIGWRPEHVASNFTRFYGENLPPGSFKEVHCGTDRFLAILVDDLAPHHDLRPTSKGERRVNTRTFDAKQRYRDWTGGGHRVHATDHVQETRHNLAMLFECSAQGLLDALAPAWSGGIERVDRDLAGCDGWPSLATLFEVLNDATDYLVMRNFGGLPDRHDDRLHGDIDLLGASAQALSHAINARKVFPQAHRVFHAAQVGGKTVHFDFRACGDGYYDATWQHVMLARRVMHAGGFFVPSPADHFYSLLYHALVHKPQVAPDYVQQLDQLARQNSVLPVDWTETAAACQVLGGFLRTQGYVVTRPDDVSVQFNEAVVRGLADAMGAPATAPQAALDEAQVHQWLLALLDKADDVALDNDFLAMVAADPRLGHALHTAAANLLRPLTPRLVGQRVLLAGGGHGVLARFLGETCAQLDVWEPRALRADVVRRRCVGLPGVHVDVQAPWEREADATFDVVIATEDVCPHGGTPADERLLRALGGCLRPGGLLVWALDNNLSLGGWAQGTGQPFLSAHGTLPLTGRAGVARSLEQAGLGALEWMYPLPDWRAPTVVLTDRGIQELPRPALRNLVSPLRMSTAARVDAPAFAEGLAYLSLVDNGLLAELSPSFLVVAQRGERDAAPAPGQKTPLALAYAYSGPRRAHLGKELQMVSDNGSFQVLRRLTSARAVASDMRFADREALLPGDLLFNRLLPVVSTPGWCVTDLVAWCWTLFDTLRWKVEEGVAPPVLPALYWDATPFNALEDGHSVRLFDLEWEGAEPVALGYVMFRGVYHSLLRVGWVAPPQAGTPLKVTTLAAAVVHHLTGVVPDVAGWLALEAKAHSRIGLHEVEASSFEGARLGTLRSAPAAATPEAPAPAAGPQRRVLVVLHLFYLEMWPEFEQRLKCLPPGSTLLVTVPELQAESARACVQAAYPDACILPVENRGRDIWPFVQALSTVDLSAFDWVLKLHTKRSPHLSPEDGERWRQDFLGALLPGPQVERLLEALEQTTRLGLSGPGEWVFPVHAGYGLARHAGQLDALAARLGLPPEHQSCQFVAGTMFWARPSVLQILKDLDFTADDFEVEAGQVDGTLAHVLERGLGLVARADGRHVLPLPPRLDRPLTPAEVLAVSQGGAALQEASSYGHTQQQAQRYLNNLAVMRRNMRAALALAPQPGVTPSLSVVLLRAAAPDAAAQHRSLQALNAQSHPADGCHVLGSTDELAALDLPADGWCLLLAEGDVLEPFALALMVEQAMAADPRAVLIYPDHDEWQSEGVSASPSFKPAANPDLLLSTPYTGRVILLRNRWWRENLPAPTPTEPLALAYHFALRASDQPGGLQRLPCVVVHVNPAVEALFATRSETWQALAQCLATHLERRAPQAHVLEGPAPGSFHVVYPLTETPLVSIVVPTRDQLPYLSRCIETLMAKTEYPAFEVIVVDNNSQAADALAFLDGLEALGSAQLRVLRAPGPFNFSRMNNLAVAQARGEFILMLNNDTAVLQADWLGHMVRHGLRPEVGVVGARLVFPDGKLQHAGVVMGLRGPADHPHIGLDATEPGYQFRAQLCQNFSAVTAACLLVRKSVYEAVGGLDETTFGVSYNDVDFCLRVNQTGLRTVWTPLAMLLHEGSASQRASVENLSEALKARRFTREQAAMYQRWPEVIADDPAYSPNLSLAERGYEIETNPLLFHDPLKGRVAHKVVAFAADAFGCGHYRILQPMQAMLDAALCSGGASPEYFDPNLALRSGADRLVFQRPTSDTDLNRLEALLTLKHVRRIYEVDDDLSRVPIKSAHHAHMPKDMRARMVRNIGLCDRLVVSTAPLAHQLRGANDDIRVVPNRLPPAMWGNTAPARQAPERQGRKPVVGWAGGAGHRGDLELIAQVVRDTADQIDWVFFGMCPDNVRPYIKAFHEGVPTLSYPRRLMQLMREWDLAVAPLEVNAFNECKSNLRLLEYGWSGVPVVCSDVVPYQCDLPVTRVKNRYKDWRNTLLQLVEAPAALAEQGAMLQTRVAQDWVLQGQHVADWYQAWTDD